MSPWSPPIWDNFTVFVFYDPDIFESTGQLFVECLSIWVCLQSPCVKNPDQIMNFWQKKKKQKWGCTLLGTMKYQRYTRGCYVPPGGTCRSLPGTVPTSPFVMNNHPMGSYVATTQMSKQMLLVHAQIRGLGGWRSNEETQDLKNLGTFFTTSWHNRQATENSSKSPTTASGMTLAWEMW